MPLFWPRGAGAWGAEDSDIVKVGSLYGGEEVDRQNSEIESKVRMRRE